MIRQTLPFFSLLSLLIVHGCTSFHYQATPYHPPDTQEVIEQSGMPGTTEHPSPLPTNSIVKDISTQANHLMRNGELDAAAQILERGLRIAPKDAFLWSQLAAVRLQQRQYEQAQSLAAKSSSLAKGNAALINRNRAIIEEAKN